MARPAAGRTNCCGHSVSPPGAEGGVGHEERGGRGAIPREGGCILGRRRRRRVVVTNSAEAVHSRLRPLLADDDRGRSGVFLSPVNDKRLRRILPSPLDEVAGVFHMKAYIVDDEIVLREWRGGGRGFLSRIVRRAVRVRDPVRRAARPGRRAARDAEPAAAGRGGPEAGAGAVAGAQK